MRRRAAGLLFLLSLLIPMPAAGGERDLSELDAWVGRYAMELRIASSMKLPLLPSERSVTTSLLLVDLERDGGKLVQRHRVCDVRMEGSSLVRAVVPLAFVEGLPARQYAALLRPVGMGEGEGGAGGWLYRADMGPEAIGFDPQATGGRLPTASGDPGVRDSDGDGHPGATIELRVPAFRRVRLFIAQHSHLVLQGRQPARDRIEGEVEIRRLDQRTLGAEPGFFSRTPSLRPDAARSGFTLVRVPESLDCERLREAASSFFRQR
ncbi:MAG TPA: hypothetical protein VGR27_03530 [Longimicrobiaceae bacterium]|nr:hypothetical protein [Longimicrobiaceae bacterium]